jgi:Tfp pilus assembly protein PilN
MNINEKIALRFTKIFGSMGTFWIFCIWAFLPLIPSLEQYKETILYISSGFIQLAALPLIMVGQEILNRSSELRAQEDHELLKEQFKDIKLLLAEIKELHHHTHLLLKKDNDVPEDL